MENKIWNLRQAKKCVQKGSSKVRAHLLKLVKKLGISSWMLQLVAKDFVEQNV